MLYFTGNKCNVRWTIFFFYSFKVFILPFDCISILCWFLCENSLVHSSLARSPIPPAHQTNSTASPVETTMKATNAGIVTGVKYEEATKKRYYSVRFRAKYDRTTRFKSIGKNKCAKQLNDKCKYWCLDQCTQLCTLFSHPPLRFIDAVAGQLIALAISRGNELNASSNWHTYSLRKLARPINGK